MKKTLILILAAVLCVISLGTGTVAFAQTASQVTVYQTGLEGLALKASADINSTRYLYIPDGTAIYIDQVSNGWGHTTYGGYSGWVSLRYTKIFGSYQAQAPWTGYISPTSYVVRGTEGEGLELRVEPTVNCSSQGTILEGRAVIVRAIINDWAYTYYNGKRGWANLTYLTKWQDPTEVTTSNYYVMVYDTDLEGLALKQAADINSARILMVPEHAVLTIDSIQNGWGHTSYGGYSGWVALRYTRVLGNYPTPGPSWGNINPVNYTVYNTQGEGLELRTKASVESSTFGPVPDGTILSVTAINNDWAYTTYNGHYGWCNLTYMR